VIYPYRLQIIYEQLHNTGPEFLPAACSHYANMAAHLEQPTRARNHLHKGPVQGGIMHGKEVPCLLRCRVYKVGEPGWAVDAPF